MMEGQEGPRAKDFERKETGRESFARKVGFFLVDLFETFLIAVLIFVFVHNFLSQSFEVYGSSMEPNFENGERILTDKITYRLREPRRGDVINFEAPHDRSSDYIKRVIGLPGEEVLIRNGKVFIYNSENPQGVELREEYLPDGAFTVASERFPDNIKVKIPKDSYFVLGDNRQNSSDSRIWGTVPKGNIIGKAWFSYWPSDKIGLIR